MKTITLLLLLLLMTGLAHGQLAWDRVDADGVGGDYGGGLPQVHAGDLDNDGDLDLAAYLAYDGISAVLLNLDGQGTQWQRVPLGSGYKPLTVADLDGDGDDDLISALHSGTAVSWWPNNGDGVFVSNLVVAGLPLANYLNNGDVDHDGDIDILVSYSSGQHVAWLENLNGDATEWEAHVVTEGLYQCSTMLLADLNGDGTPDLLTTSEGPGNEFGVHWWDNVNGDGSTWVQNPVYLEWYGASDIVARDMDDDGDLDVVASSWSNGKVSWFENETGLGDSWLQHPLPMGIGWHGLYPERIDAADMDGDGDVDVVAACSGDNKHLLFDNVDGNGTLWARYELSVEDEHNWDVITVDVNADGVIDVVQNTHGNGYVTVLFQPIDRAVTVTPTSSTDLPANGGTISYQVHVLNQSNQTFPAATFWTDVILPNGEVYGPTFSYGFTLNTGVDFTYDGLAQTVPPFAPEGSYVFRAHLGYPGNGWLADTFGFSKAGVVAEAGGSMSGTGPANGWETTLTRATGR